MNPTEQKKSIGAKLKTAIGVVVVIVIGAIVALFKGANYGTQIINGSVGNSGDAQSAQSATPVADGNTTQTSTAPASAPAATAQSAATAPAASASAYKDGTYSASGNYNSPGGPDSISVTLTLKNDIVTDANVVPNPGDRTSARYQNMFVSGYKQYVVGQDISTLNLTKVSGSSLTPVGFDAALAKIKSQAQS